MLLLTKHRKRILELVRNSSENLTAERIFAVVKEDSEPIGIATVYRSLNLLFDAGYIHRAHHPKIGYVYSAKASEHYHFHCNNCHEVIDISLPYHDGFNEEVKKYINGKIRSHTILFEGICDACESKEINEN